MLSCPWDEVHHTRQEQAGRSCVTPAAGFPDSALPGSPSRADFLAEEANKQLE